MTATQASFDPPTDRIELVPQARFDLQRRRTNSEHTVLWDILDNVKDPEIPVLSIWDLGILQNVATTKVAGEVTVEVVITPTYSGCPAMQQISSDVCTALQAAGYPQVNVRQQLHPAWSTDWMTPAAKRQLRNYGVAPPGDTSCPQCGSKDTSIISEFGSTSCKALLRCNTCLEPFDMFKRL